MEYKINGYVKDDKSFYVSKCCEYTSEIIPHIGECICLPHKGSYRIFDVVYHISDDGNEYDNRIMMIDLFLKPYSLHYY